MAIELSPPERLGKIVVLGYCDIGAAGIRVVHGLSCRKEENSRQGEEAGELRETGRESLKFSGMGSVAFDGMPGIEAVHLEHMKDDDEQREAHKTETPAMTLIKLNTEVPEELSASLAVAIADLLGARGTSLDALVVVAAVQPPKRNQVARKGKQTTGKTCSAIPSDVVCAFSSASRDRKHADANADASPLILDLPVVKKLERIPSNARIADPFLTNLIALCRLEGVPLLLVAREGYRATGAEASHDGTDQAIVELGRCLGEILRVRFDAKEACGLRLSTAWKRTAPARSGDALQGYI